MNKALQKPVDALYEQDFHAWLDDQAAKLRARSHNDIDWDNLAEEIESVGRSQKHEIRSRMKILLQHLLKWDAQPAGRSQSWQSSISEQRVHIAGIVADSPSLRGFPAEALAWAYPYARRAASAETGLSPSAFADHCPYTVEQALDDDFMPGEAWSVESLHRD